MTSSAADNQENSFKWIIRYVLIPVTLAITAGWFALEVVRLQHSLTPLPPPEVDYEGIFATMTAVAPADQPPTPTLAATSTPVAEATPTAAGDEANPGEPDLFKPAPEQPPVQSRANCGWVPPGWQIYTVQPGNTLYSLARQRGTTVEAIQQANCLYGPLLAYSRIWLPGVVDAPKPPVDDPTGTVTPSVTLTPTLTPTLTVTPTMTVTEPAALPDLINNTANGPTISVNCSTEQGGCVTTVNLAVSNVGEGASAGFDLLVVLDPQQAVVLNQLVAGLEPGETAVLSLSSPPGGNCYDPDCTVCVTVDSRGAVPEENENNNLYCTTFQG